MTGNLIWANFLSLNITKNCSNEISLGTALNLFFSRVLLAPSFLFVLFSALLDNFDDVVMDSGVLLLELLRIRPLGHLREHESFAVFDGILPIKPP